MIEKSIWEDRVNIKDFPTLQEDKEVDVLIVGGGISGILLAYELKKRNIDYMLVEKNKIGSGTSKDTTCFLTAQHETLYQDLIKDKGIKKAKEYLKLNLLALRKYRELSRIYDFDYKECESCLYSRDDEEIILKEKKALDTLGYKTKLVDKIPINIDIKKGIVFENQAVINPLKLIKEISKDLNIYEYSKVDKIRGNIAYSNSHKIKFNKVVIATHYPFKNIEGLYFAKLTQRRSYVVSVLNDDIKNTYCGIDDNSMYFRSYGRYLLIGGNDRDNKEMCKRDFFNKVKDMIGDKNIEYSWSGQDCITLDGIPYIGKFSLIHPSYYVITGFNLWGFTWAMASSFIISDLIEKKKEYPLVDPLRNFINKNLFINIGTSIKNIVNFKTPRCKHLGSKLNYNKVEKVWECPCHGSRYDRWGRLLDGPSKKGLDKENIEENNLLKDS